MYSKIAAILLAGSTTFASASTTNHTPLPQHSPPLVIKSSPKAASLDKDEIIKLIDERLTNQQILEQLKVAVNNQQAAITESTQKPEISNQGFMLQQVFVPAVVSPDDNSTILSAGTLESQILNSGTATIGELSVEQNFQLQGEANIIGTSTFATSSITQLNVGLINADSGAFLSSGGVWTNVSSKELKENFVKLDGAEILNKINALNVSKWNYKKEPVQTTHIGPTAEDFYEKFALGGEEGKTSISTIDPAGVALVGIQELSKKIAVLENEIKQLKNQLNTQPIITTEKTDSSQTEEVGSSEDSKQETQSQYHKNNTSTESKNDQDLIINP